MDWNDLRFLLAVHQRGSLAAAAKELKVTKATVSRRLSALEEALGTKLFDRKPNGLQLTAVGQAAIEAAEGVAAQVDELTERVALAGEKVRGVVRLTAPPWLAARVVIPSLPALKAKHPELDVQLLGSNHIVNLPQREADLAIRNVKPTQQSLTARKVGRIGGCVYASRLYLERRGAPDSPAEVRGHDVLTYEGLGGMPGYEWIATSGTAVFSANDPEALASAAAAGLGLTAVPCLIGDAQPSLVRIAGLGISYTDIFVVAAAGSPRRIRAVSDFIAEVFSANRALLEGG